MKEGHIQSISLDSNYYSKLLKQITDPPKVLYYCGNLELLNMPALAIVGSRKCTSYGRLTCQSLLQQIVSETNLVTVSGLAVGIDTVVHETTIQNNGKTIAVLGSGIDDASLYPKINISLKNEIIKKGGLVISEYEPWTKPTRYTFPQRNRIIAGLSLGCLVIEAAKKSGALITSSCALDYNRDVMAIPHPVQSTTGEGCNELLKNGAVLVNSYLDILNTIS